MVRSGQAGAQAMEHSTGRTLKHRQEHTGAQQSTGDCGEAEQGRSTGRTAEHRQDGRAQHK